VSAPHHSQRTSGDVIFCNTFHKRYMVRSVPKHCPQHDHYNQDVDRQCICHVLIEQ
jgi:hypothetical protein